uniref:RNA-directed RNA polymerase n=1 Tax=Riboviria sp. TaxID=2585031 RepID=A0A514D4A0_9VIRU|nr:MAG: RNA-dependent RNA polymerase [Riboviria sp.]
MEEFGVFVKTYVQKHFKPLDPTTDLSIESWLEGTTYPAHRKQELQQLWEKNKDSVWDPKFQQVKGFGKDEVYPSYKHERGINSRHDLFKCAVGPTFKAIEKEVFKDPHFIKYVPVSLRGRHVMEKLYRVGAKIFGSDYTSFEALMTRLFQSKSEWILYEHMTQFLPSGKRFMRLVKEVIGGTNKIIYKLFVVWIEAVRMSGEMNTSLGNGFNNTMAFLFVCHKIGVLNPDCFVEGDDLIGTLYGPTPKKEDFAKLGLICKPEYPQSLSEASFCGIIADEEAMDVITDPIEAISNFGWTTREYARATPKVVKKLLRCKALSMAHQYPGCPLLSAFAEYVLRMTRGINVVDFVKTLRVSAWERDQILEAVKDEKKLRGKRKAVHKNTRHLVEKKFGIKIEHQTAIEAYFDSLTDLCELDHELLDMYVPTTWKDYFSRYHRELKTLDRTIDHPSRLWPQIPVGSPGHVSIPPAVFTNPPRARKPRKGPLFI